MTRIQRATFVKNIAWASLPIWTIAVVFLHYGYSWASLATSALSGCVSLASIAISKGWIK